MSSDVSYNEIPSGDENSENNPGNSSRESPDDSSQEYSESSILTSDKEFGPETTRPNEVDDLVELPVAWVPTFKERIGKLIGRLLNDSQKFCVSGKMTAPPIVSISLPKVKKFISFPLYEDMLAFIIPAFEQSAFGRGTETIVDTTFRNSWELSSTDFEIMNTGWNSYLIDVLMPLLQQDLRLEVGFRLSLYKLLLYKTGSFFKPHRDSEKDAGMFGTVVIQLPSIYEGGKLIVRHNHKMEEVDNSSATTSQNGFCIFYTAFYCDCEHEVRPVTGGVRVCLVYNLVLTGETQTKSFPSAARLERESREADLVDLLRSSWSTDRKLVYCLAHKYSQKSLSLHNLKSTDRLLGQFFLKYADSCGLKVMIGFLKRKKYRYAEAVPRKVSPRPRREPNYMYQYNLENGYEYLNWNYNSYDDDQDDIATISDVDSNDPTVNFYDDYKLKHLKSLDQEQHSNLPSLYVDFEGEVLPENSFQDIKAFHEDQNETGNEGVQCSKFYQCAAIVVFHRDDLVPVLVQGHAKLAKIEETFLKEFNKQKDNLTNENIKEKCLKWSHATMDTFINSSYGDNVMQKWSEMFENFLMLDNIELLQKFLKIQKFEEGNFSYLYRICQKHGWNAFSADIKTRFEKLRAEQRIITLQKIIDYEDTATSDDTERQTIIHSLMNETLKKFEHELKHPPREPWHRYSPRPLKKDQITEKTRKFLISLWPLANRISFQPLVDYAKSKSMNIAVPALISVAKNDENIRNDLWLDVADHFKLKMEIILNEPVEPTFTWKQNVNLQCRCKDCQFVEEFLQRPFQQTLDFFGKKPIRNHVQQTIVGLADLNIFTTNSGVLRIKKLRKTGEVQSEERNFVSSNLSKITSLMAAKAAK
ncbi:uncharacterized protein LOC119073453 [Bradysia coprophila]|uniref:uncharacterized protein LOC119073453 n=1 Tax=Bradysia coprophila TaxID=38358 RepID=UPI00187D8097|nr:uncharacterized protein LOC119073453 [Bradysia coprophila]